MSGYSALFAFGKNSRSTALNTSVAVCDEATRAAPGFPHRGAHLNAPAACNALGGRATISRKTKCFTHCGKLPWFGGQCNVRFQEACRSGFQAIADISCARHSAVMTKSEYPGDDIPSLTAREAFDAMRYFLEAFWERGSRSSEGVGFPVERYGWSATRDGGPIDSAQWSDWLDAVRKVEAQARAKRH